MPDEQQKKLILFDIIGTLDRADWAPLIQDLRENGHIVCACTSLDSILSFEDNLTKRGIELGKDPVEMRATKDWPEYYRTLAKKYGVNVEDIILIDDGDTVIYPHPADENINVLAAQEAGAQGIHIDSRNIDMGYVRGELIRYGALQMAA